MGNKNLVALTLFTVFVSACSKSQNNGVSNTSTSSSIATVGQQDSAQLANAVLNSVRADTANAADPGSAQSSSGTVAIPMVSANAVAVSNSANCITVKESTVLSDVDILRTFACPSLNGTVEFKASLGSSDSFEMITKLNYAGSKVSAALNSDTTSTWSGGNVGNIQSNSDNTFTIGTDVYEVKSSHSYVYTPDNMNSLQGGGAVQINSSGDYIKNGSDLGSFTVVSTGLHRSRCGFDSGSIEIKRGGSDVVINFTSCTQHTVTGVGGLTVP